MASWRRFPALLRFDDVLAILFSLALVILGARHTASLDHTALVRFLVLVFYYAAAFLFSRWLARTSRVRVWHKRILLGALMAAVALFSLSGGNTPSVETLKNVVVLELPLVAGTWAALSLETSRGGPGVSLLRDFAPFLVSQAAYLMLHGLVHEVSPVDRDTWLIRIDEMLFGGAWTQWLQPFVSTWLTEWFSVTYSLYVFFPIALALWFVARGERGHLLHLLQAVVLCTYLGYLGYLLVPAVGPLYTLTYQVPLGGGWFSQVRESLDAMARVPRDCFPSLHTANTVVVLWMVWRHARPLRGVFGVLGVSCILATIYLRYHYTVDVAAGLLLGTSVAALTPWLARKWDRLAQAIAPRPETTCGS